MNFWGFNGGFTNLFGRENGGTGVSGSLTPLMSESPAASVNDASIGGGLNGKGTLPSVEGGSTVDAKPGDTTNVMNNNKVTEAERKKMSAFIGSLASIIGSKANDRKPSVVIYPLSSYSGPVSFLGMRR